MGDYDNLDKFNLSQHGDYWEQHWAQLVLRDFPAYEIFWRRYVVPLTNRIDAAIPASDRGRWIRLRLPIDELCERMAMQHYSVFYYLARATENIHAKESCPFPEDAFTLLDACGDNVRSFFASVKEFLGDFSQPIVKLPADKKRLCSDGDLSKPDIRRGGFVAVQKYRDIILHNPVLGRAMDRSRTSLPRQEVLERIKSSWRNAERLVPSELIDSRELLLHLHGEIASFLQQKWVAIVGALDVVRSSSKFKMKYRLEAFLPINAPTVVPTTLQPFAASGTLVYSPTAAAVLSSSTFLESQD